MKKFEKELKVRSTTAQFIFIFCFALLSVGIYSSIYENHKTVQLKIELILLISLLIYGIYRTFGSSANYKLTPTEIIEAPFFGILKKKSYPFKSLKQIEYSMLLGSCDYIVFEFEGENGQKRISISKDDIQHSRVKKFLENNLENYESIPIVEKNRKFLW